VDAVAIGVATLLLAGAAGCAALAWRGRQHHLQGLNQQTAGAAAAQAGVAAAAAANELSQRARLDGSEPGWLRVADADTLLAVVHAQTTLDQLMRQSRLSAKVWERDLLPALRAYAALVQLLPASESHHHAHAGGLLAHTLEVVLAAVTWRNGCLLPQGAPAEHIDAQRDYWTFVVFFAALLHDVGKPLTDLRIEWRRPGSSQGLRWQPMGGGLLDCGAQEYRVAFAPKGERDYAAHQRLGVLLMQRVAPATALSFLAQEPQALQTLTGFLQGEDRDSAVARLVRRADQASTARALAQGSRARFASAVSVPLAELLTQALRNLLYQGALPLNRDGAAGWVHDGSVWFVAKRLADQVREHLKQHAPEEGVPGEQKNDRLFDAWQEYGCLIQNPLTQQAIWHVNVHGEDAAGAESYCHKLSMLRFALNKLWDDPTQYPAPMAGRIEVLAGRKPAAEAVGDPGQAAAAGVGQAQKAAAISSSNRPAPAGQGSPSAPVAPDEFLDSADEAASVVDEPPTALASPIAQAEAAGHLDAGDDASSEARAARRARTRRIMAPVPTPRGAGGAGKRDGLGLVDPAAAAAPAPQLPARSLRLLPRAEPEPPGAAEPGPVVLTMALPPLPGAAGAGAARAPSLLATAFLQWLQAGLASRAITFNNAGAWVHFVPQGMALVSPLIFKEFAQQQGLPGEPERVAKDVQREVLKAGWHVPAAGGQNIHRFVVRGRGGVPAGRLAAVVLDQPHRWVVPVPPPNPAIGPAEAAPATVAESDAS
jgi:integrating conjugative element relaxase (TIGR03760 family)